MSHKYEHVSTGNGFSVKNGAVTTPVINQDGTLNGSAVIDDNSVTSAKIEAAVQKVAVVNLTAANLIAMYTTPILVVAAIAGKAIIVDSVDFDITRTATQFSGGGTSVVQYNSTANGAGTATTAIIAAAVITAGAGRTVTHRISVVLSDVATASITGIGLYFSNIDGVFASGTGTAVLTVRYHTV